MTRPLRLALLSGGSLSLAAAIAAHIQNEKAMAEAAPEIGMMVDGETGQEMPMPPAPELVENPALAGLPDSHPDWRYNYEALRPITANSPLETRQQRRAAAKDLARGLSTAGKLKEREARLQQKKRDRADAAARRYARIAAHVPSSSY